MKSAARRRRGKSRSIVIVIVLAAVLVGAAAPASAQNSDAEALFSEAEQLEKAGKVDESCEAFEASNRIEPRAGTLIRLGGCREAQGRVASAWSAYKDALTRVKDPRKKAIAESKVKELEPKLSYLMVLVPDESRVDGLAITRNGTALDPALWNRAAPVDGGNYRIAGSAPGHEEWSTTVEVANEADKVEVEVPRFKELRALVGEPPPVTDPAETGDEHESRSSPRMFTTRRKIAVGVAGVGVVAAVAGAALGSQAKGLEDEAYALCPDPDAPCDGADAAQDDLDRARQKAFTANIAFGVAGAAVVGAVVLWFTGGPPVETPEVAGARLSGSAGPGLAKLDLTWSF